MEHKQDTEGGKTVNTCLTSFPQSFYRCYILDEGNLMKKRPGLGGKKNILHKVNDPLKILYCDIAFMTSMLFSLQIFINIMQYIFSNTIQNKSH